MIQGYQVVSGVKDARFKCQTNSRNHSPGHFPPWSAPSWVSAHPLRSAGTCRQRGLTWPNFAEWMKMMERLPAIETEGHTLIKVSPGFRQTRTHFSSVESSFSMTFYDMDAWNQHYVTMSPDAPRPHMKQESRGEVPGFKRRPGNRCSIVEGSQE